MNSLLALGLILAVGFVGGEIARQLGLPSVTGYLVAGMMIGPSFAGLLTGQDLVHLQPVNDFALGLIGLSIGGELRWRFLKRKWRTFGLLFISEGFATFLLVFLLTFALIRDLPLALLLGILALATAPGSILDVINESNARGPFPRLLMSLVALDNLLCIAAFTVVVTVLNLYYAGTGLQETLLGHLSREIGLALLLGISLGFAGLTIVNRVQRVRQRQILIVAIMFLAVGLPRQLEVSYLLVTLLAAPIIVNFTPHFRRFYETLHTIDTPVLVAFLTLAGAKLRLEVLPAVGLLGLVYVAGRLLGKIGGPLLGARIGARMSDRAGDVRRQHAENVGMALTPQAGVAIGLSVVAEQKLPLPDEILVTLILGSVIFFELVGPVLVTKALRNAGATDEVGSEEDEISSDVEVTP